MTLRHIFCWKSLFYEALLPASRRLGPARADAILRGLGRVSLAWPSRRAAFANALSRASGALDAPWSPESVRAPLAESVPRFLARDYPLEGTSDAQLADRFEVRGFEHVQNALAQGRGVILLGSHLGGHMAALHWLYRREVPLRLLVQRPRHVSPTLHRRFDRIDGPHPQNALFLRRNLPPGAAAERMLRARSALRDNLAVYLAGDIPWPGANARPGRLLGETHNFLSIWADLAILARSPVVPVFCTHLPSGRFQLTFDPAWTLAPGTEAASVARYLERLESVVADHPADAVAYLTWPCYGPNHKHAQPKPYLPTSLRNS